MTVVRWTVTSSALALVQARVLLKCRFWRIWSELQVLLQRRDMTLTSRRSSLRHVWNTVYRVGFGCDQHEIYHLIVTNTVGNRNRKFTYHCIVIYTPSHAVFKVLLQALNVDIATV